MNQRSALADGQDMGRVVVASNRGPVSFSQDSRGELVARRGGGGLVSGLMSVADRADLLWICAAMSEDDRAAAQRTPGGRLDLDGTAEIRMLDIPAGVFAAAYNSVANSTLWFVSHLLYNTPVQPAFGPEFAADWAAYREYNTAFALALAESAPGPGTQVLVQDYHLALVPAMLARLRPGARIAHFSHTPWAPPDYFRLLPVPVARELLEGMLGGSHAGFLADRWADAFLDCCETILGAAVDRAARRVHHRGHA